MDEHACSNVSFSVATFLLAFCSPVVHHFGNGSKERMNPMKPRMTILVVLFAMISSGCISSAESEMDTLPDLYDGSRMLGRVMSYNGREMVVWNHWMDALAFYEVSGENYEYLTLQTRFSLWFPESDCKGTPYTISRSTFSRIVTSCSDEKTKQIEALEIPTESCLTYFVDRMRPLEDVSTKSVFSEGICSNSYQIISGNAYEAQVTDIPVVVLRPEIK
jgi:hypothetical protein